MIDQEDLERGFARQVPPTYQQQNFLGGEVVPMSGLCVMVAIGCFEAPSWAARGVVIGVGVVVALLMRFIFTEIDPKFFSVKQGFADRGYYLGGSSLLEFVRELGRWKWF